VIVKKRKKRKKTKLRFFWNKAKKNEYNRFSTIEDLPLLLLTLPFKTQVSPHHVCIVQPASPLQSNFQKISALAILLYSITSFHFYITYENSEKINKKSGYLHQTFFTFNRFLTVQASKYLLYSIEAPCQNTSPPHPLHRPHRKAAKAVQQSDSACV
jgi:hypothetical protein